MIKKWPKATVSELNSKAILKRKLGELFNKNGDEMKAAAEYTEGIKIFDEVLCLLKDPQWYRLEELPSHAELTDDQLEIAEELVEAWGARGGLLRRLGDSAGALESYENGAEVEKNFFPKSTYNRVNVVKYSLLCGTRSLSSLDQEIRLLEKLLTDTLASNQTLSDKGWAWADLGDCRALLGNVAGAERAYRTFVEKAGSKAPNTTLEVLRDILSKLNATHDPRAVDVSISLELLEQRMK